MTAVSLRGYWRTDSERIDWTPAIRMTRLTTIARTGRRTKRSVKDFTLAVLRLRSRVVAGLDLVVDLDGGPVAQLEHAGRDHGLTRLDAGGHRHLVAAGGADLDELLAHTEVALALRVLDLL